MFQVLLILMLNQNHKSLRINLYNIQWHGVWNVPDGSDLMHVFVIIDLEFTVIVTENYVLSFVLLVKNVFQKSWNTEV